MRRGEAALFAEAAGAGRVHDERLIPEEEQLVGPGAVDVRRREDARAARGEVRARGDSGDVAPAA